MFDFIAGIKSVHKGGYGVYVSTSAGTKFIDTKILVRSSESSLLMGMGAGGGGVSDLVVWRNTDRSVEENRPEEGQSRIFMLFLIQKSVSYQILFTGSKKYRP